MSSPIKIGVSACLLGEYVRYDGGRKQDRNITDNLGTHFTFVSVCPEVGCGLSTPREAMRLEGDPVVPRLMTRQTRVDKTEQMLAYCMTKIKELESQDLCGFIFKERSPSCGLTAVPVCLNDSNEMFTVGLFASEMVRSFPLMPMVESEYLHNSTTRKEFIEKIRFYHDMRKR